MKTHKQEFEDEIETVYHRGRPVKPILGGFLVGSVIGVATALLFAPRSGTETRADIRDREASAGAAERSRGSVSDRRRCRGRISRRRQRQSK